MAKKYKEQLEEYRVMEIELKELRKNFAKSELIRTQQKKVIETLHSIYCAPQHEIAGREAAAAGGAIAIAIANATSTSGAAGDSSDKNGPP